MTKKTFDIGPEIQERVRYLFETFRGVEIEWVRKRTHMGDILFGMKISDQRSLICLVRVSEWANIPVSVYAVGGDRADYDDPDCLRYSFRVPIPTDEDLEEDRLWALEEALTRETSWGKYDPLDDED